MTFLLAWAYGMGGLVRTTVNTANHFAEQGHEVTVLSMFRHRDTASFDIRPDVRMQSLMDLRPGAQRGRLEEWQRRQPSRLVPRYDRYHERITLYGDQQLIRALRSLDADVLVSTRPAFNLAAAMWAPAHTVTIGQDHLNYKRHDETLRSYMRHWYPRLDAMVTLTEADRRDYAKLLRDADTDVRAIGNAVTAGPHPVTDNTQPVIVAAGRLTGQKRYTHLVKAFAAVHEAHPDWQLRIFGSGRDGQALRAQIERLGLADHARLMGRTHDIEGEFSRSSIMAMSSKYEGFPMVILEAFGCGLPVVSYDCPRGPGEMITSGYDGLLVRNGRPDALAEALCRLIQDRELRQMMSRNALQTADQNSMKLVGEQWDSLFDELRAKRDGRPRPPRPLAWAAKRAIRESQTRRREKAAAEPQTVKNR